MKEQGEMDERKNFARPRIAQRETAHRETSRRETEGGFSYIDVMIGITILLVGVLALAAAITAGVVRSREGEQRLIAKQLANSTIESIFAARDMIQLRWESIGNIGNNPVNGEPSGKFLSGRNPIRLDDGTDKVYGTADDTGDVMPNFERQIKITDICDPERPSANCPVPGSYPVMMRLVEVSIFYQGVGLWREEKITTLVTNSLLEPE